jgi:hypothetical protein
MPSLSNSLWMRGAPHPKILGGHPADQVADLLGCWRASWALRLPTPEEAKAPVMPSDHCVGTDDDENVGPVCPNAGEPRPEDPVCALELEPTGPRTAEHHELLAEGKVLESQVLAGANQGAQGSEEGDEHGEHGGILPRFHGPLR